jgi:hypothetical protein
MASHIRERLLNDHQDVSGILKRLLSDLHDWNVEAAYSRLDLFWARLAVHIRAEHLHLFPIVLNGLAASSDDKSAPDLREAQSVVEGLRADHDFFMRELPRALRILRELTNPHDDPKLTEVGNIVLDVETRLATHNEIEEDKIYHWAGTILTSSEQTELAKQINAELENRPPRFSLQTWVTND